MSVNYQYTGLFGMSFVPASNTPIPSAEFDSLMVKHSWDSWHLIPENRPRFSAARHKSHTVEIPGGSGLIDLAPVLSYYPLMDNRTGSFSFILPDFVLESEEATWADVYTDICEFMQGKVLGCILDEDPDFAYIGYFDVGSMPSEDVYSKLTIEYSVYPYKMSQNFDVIHRLENTAKTVNLIVGDAPVTLLKARLVDENQSGEIVIGDQHITLSQDYKNVAPYVDPFIASNLNIVPVTIQGTGEVMFTMNVGLL